MMKKLGLSFTRFECTVTLGLARKTRLLSLVQVECESAKLLGTLV